jgi:hypothetical protein
MNREAGKCLDMMGGGNGDTFWGCDCEGIFRVLAWMCMMLEMTDLSWMREVSCLAMKHQINCHPEVFVRPKLPGRKILKNWKTVNLFEL